MKRVQFLLSARFLLTCFLLLGSAMQYMQKIDMGMAIVCMINNTALNLENNNDEFKLTSFYKSPIENDTCLFQPLNSTKRNDGPFEWSKKDQGLILSSYFYGYLIIQIPGGWLAHKFGGKKLVAFSMLLGSILTLLVPWTSNLGLYSVIICRFLTGFVHGSVKPSISSIFLKWAPLLERSRLIGFADSGNALGNIAALISSGYLCQKGQWSLIFYLFGIFGIVWVILFIIFTSETPSENFYISKSESEYIYETTKDSRPSNENQKLSLLLIFKSKSCWAIFVSHCCVNWANYLFLTQLPSFMNDILRFDFKSNGLFSTLPYIAFFFIAILSSILSDYLITKQIFNRKVVRKIFNGSGFFISMVVTLGLCFITCEKPYVAVGMLTIGYGVIGMCIGAGYHVNINEVGGEYCSIVYGFSNTFGTIPGIIAPYIVGIITKNKKQEEWQLVFIISSCVYLFGFIFYSIFGDCEPISKQQNDKEFLSIQNVNYVEEEEEKN